MELLEFLSNFASYLAGLFVFLFLMFGIKDDFTAAQIELFGEKVGLASWSRRQKGAGILLVWIPSPRRRRTYL